MGFLVGRDGNISVIRLGALLGGVGLVLIIGGLVIFSFEQASYQSPLYIEPYPGAVEWGINQISNTSRSQLWQIPGKTPEEVVAFYQQKLDQYYGNDPNAPDKEKCVRVPDEPDIFPDYKEGAGNLPYYFRCLFDRSGFRLLQVTEVVIQPGVLKLTPDGEVEFDTRGMTVVEYRQQWER